MATKRRPKDDDVTLEESDGFVVATDEETGVASQGETRADALENLADALRLHERPLPADESDPDEPTDAPWI